MPLVSISDALKVLLDTNPRVVKGKYLTLKMYVDSAVREKLRRDGVAGVGEDEIIPHLRKLEESSSRRHDKQAVRRTRHNHERRMRRAQDKLSQ